MKSPEKTLLNKINNLSILKNKKIGLAVSGGVDSIVLLDLINSLKEDFNITIFILHFNHKWRKESVKDKLLIKKYSEKYSLPLLYDEDKGKIIKSEEHARNQRNLFFSKVYKKYKLDYLLTAHHFNDQIETIVFRIARGSGPKGFLPIKENIEYSNKIKFYRPLLKIQKIELITYAKNKKLKYLEDKTNKNLAYNRNLIRHKIIPLFNKINPNAENNIFLSAELVYMNALVLDVYFKKILNDIKTNSNKEWNKSKFIKLSPNVQRTFLYWFFSENNILGSISKLGEIINLIYEKGSLDLNKELRLVVDKKTICFLVKKNNLLAQEEKIFKEIHLNNLNNKNKKINLDNNQILVIKKYDKKNFNKKFLPDYKKFAYVDLSKYTDKKITIRYRRSKDIFNPIGSSYSMKVKNFFINKKIPIEIRNFIPMLCFQNEVLWIPGYALSNKLKVITKPTHALSITTR